jgi:hypothetical protein
VKDNGRVKGKDHSTLIKYNVCEEVISATNVYAPNNSVALIYKAKTERYARRK